MFQDLSADSRRRSRRCLDVDRRCSPRILVDLVTTSWSNHRPACDRDAHVARNACVGPGLYISTWSFVRDMDCFFLWRFTLNWGTRVSSYGRPCWQALPDFALP